MNRLCAAFALLAAAVLGPPLAAAVPTTVVQSGQTVTGAVAIPQSPAKKLCGDGAVVDLAADCPAPPPTVTVVDAAPTQNGVFKFANGLVSGATIAGYTVNHAYRTIEVTTTSAGSSSLKNVVIRDLTCLDVQRGCIRLKDADGVLIANVKARFKPSQTPTMHDLPAGLQFEGNERNITVDGFDCAGFQMNMPATEYENGDCINADAEGPGFKFLNIAANDNTDAGLDSKALNPVIDNFSASGNKRNLRLWHGCDCGTLYIGQPLKRGGIGAGAGIWFKGGAAGGLAHIRKLVVNFTNADYPVLLFENAQAVTIDACELHVPAGTRLMMGPKGAVKLGPGCQVP